MARDEVTKKPIPKPKIVTNKQGVELEIADESGASDTLIDIASDLADVGEDIENGSFEDAYTQLENLIAQQQVVLAYLEEKK